MRSAVRSLSSARRAVHSLRQRDFDWESLRKSVSVPEFAAPTSSAPPNPAAAAEQVARWEASYGTHTRVQSHLFKERRYLMHQFPLLSEPDLRILEVGCGNGSSTLPVYGFCEAD